jgi:hypothetical protein
VRPEDVVVDAAGASSVVVGIEHLGSHGYADVELAPALVFRMRTDGPPPAIGSTVPVKLERIHLFHPVTGEAIGPPVEV